jgi:hypothetical protein
LVQKCGFEEGTNKHTSCVKKPENDKTKVKRSSVLGPYIPYGLFQTKRELCAKFGSDWFRNVNLYKVQTNTHTHKLTFSFIYKIKTIVDFQLLVEILAKVALIFS